MEVKELDIYDAIEFTNKTENKNKYATFVRCVSEDKLYLRFIFLFNDGVYFVKYNKREGRAKTYKFVCDLETIEPIIYLHNNNLTVPVNSLEDSLNASLAIIDESLL